MTDFLRLACIFLIEGVGAVPIAAFVHAAAMVASTLGISLLVRHMCTQEQVTTAWLLHRGLPFGVAVASLQLAAVMSLEEWTHAPQVNSVIVGASSLWIVLLLLSNLALAVLVQYLSTWVAVHTSTLLYAVLGQAKTAATLALSACVFHVTLSRRVICGVATYLSVAAALSICDSDTSASKADTRRASLGSGALRKGLWVLLLATPVASDMSFEGARTWAAALAPPVDPAGSNAAPHIRRKPYLDPNLDDDTAFHPNPRAASHIHRKPKNLASRRNIQRLLRNITSTPSERSHPLAQPAALLRTHNNNLREPRATGGGGHQLGQLVKADVNSLAKKSMDTSWPRFVVRICLCERPSDPRFEIPAQSSLRGLSLQTYPHWRLAVRGDGLSQRAERSVRKMLQRIDIPDARIEFRNLPGVGSFEKRHYPNNSALRWFTIGGECLNQLHHELYLMPRGSTHVAALDDDDEWLPSHLSSLAYAFKQSPDASVAFTRATDTTALDAKLIPSTKLNNELHQLSTRVCPMESDCAATRAVWFLPPLPCATIHSSVSWSIAAAVLTGIFYYRPPDYQTKPRLPKTLVERSSVLSSLVCTAKSKRQCSHQLAPGQRYICPTDADLWDRIWDEVNTKRLVSLFIDEMTVLYHGSGSHHRTLLESEINLSWMSRIVHCKPRGMLQLRDAVVHIGPEKSGSSHMQAFIRDNYERLKQLGWAWPR
jgi:hypothetical protein